MPRKPVAGVGINDAEYAICSTSYISGRKVQITCPFYVKWHSMLQRCYNSNVLKKRPSYLSCTVCEEWIRFSNFKRWMETQNWQGRELDKDLKYVGNSLYSPETCLFLPKEVNGFLITPVKTEKHSGFPIGVVKTKRNLTKPYGAQVWIDGKQYLYRWFLTAEDAHKKWQEVKIELARNLSQKYEGEDFSVYLSEYADKIELDLLNGVQTQFVRRV